MNTWNLKRNVSYLILGFIALFTLRLIYGYVVYPNGGTQIDNDVSFDIESFVLERKNYASDKIAYKGAASTPQAPIIASVDQKYEKIGSLMSATSDYDKDEKVLYDLIKRQQLMIQLEQRAGLKPVRQLNIALGVVPDKFDDTIQSLRQIGTLKNIQIDKNDKTNEYKKLEAQRVSLLKARDSLMELKNENANVTEKVSLTDRLLDLENQIQALGVSLGEFDAQNEFCTIKFTLKETRPAKIVHISLAHRAKTALSWSVQIYAIFWMVAAFGLFALWILSILMGKLKQWSHQVDQK